MKKPNVLIFMTDQQRGNTVYPYNKAYTPNIENFAKQGVTFTQSHTVAPHCCPSRASFLTGLYPSEHGVWNNVNVSNAFRRGMYDGVKLFTEDFKENGYNMYYIGKWHISNYEGPLGKGKFDFYHGDKRVYNEKDHNFHPFDEMEWKKYYDYTPQSVRGEAEILRRGYATYTHYATDNRETTDDLGTRVAVDIIKNKSEFNKNNSLDLDEGAPWLQIVSLGNPHDPYFAKQKFLDFYDVDDIHLPKSYSDYMEDKPGLYRKTAEKFRQLSEREYKESLRHYYACCSEQDDKFGQILSALDETGESDNTIVVYISDHGDYTGDHGLWCKGLPCFEGAYHIPTIIRYPNGIKNPNSIVNDFNSIADIAPTLLQMCGIEYDRHMTGKSLVPYLNNEEIEEPQTELYTQSNGNEIYGIQRSVRNKKWKYTYNGFDFDEFYDLENDPDEMYNLYDKYKDSIELKEMSIKMWKFAKKTKDLCVNPYVMVGLASYGPGVIYEDC